MIVRIQCRTSFYSENSLLQLNLNFGHQRGGSKKKFCTKDKLSEKKTENTREFISENVSVAFNEKLSVSK